MCGTKLCTAESEGGGILKKCNIGIPGLCNLSFSYSVFLSPRSDKKALNRICPGLLEHIQ